MQLDEVMMALEAAGSSQTRKIYAAHGNVGARPLDCDGLDGGWPGLYGVNIADLKAILKPIRGNAELARALFGTGNVDAMYLAALVAHGSKHPRTTLERWVKDATAPLISDYAVPWTASEHPDATMLADGWIDDPRVHVAAAGWATWACVVQMRPDSTLEPSHLRSLVARVERDIDVAPPQVRLAMNGFLIALGAGVFALFDDARAAAERIGVVSVVIGERVCRVPAAVGMLDKLADTGRVGRKRPTCKC
jgi:hypothetical protein